MAAQFYVHRRGEKPGKAIGRIRALLRVRRYLGNKGPARYTRRGHDYPDHFTQAKAVFDRFRKSSAVAPVGALWFLERYNAPNQLTVRKVESQKARAEVDLGCNPKLERIHYDLWNRFGEPKLRSAGRFYCRFVDGTTEVSYHGYVGKDNIWQGAAEDVFPENGMTLDRIAGYLRKGTPEKPDRIIWEDKSWTPGGGITSYGGEYHYHVHYEIHAGHACNP